jgi:hypothetical protein
VWRNWLDAQTVFQKDIPTINQLLELTLLNMMMACADIAQRLSLVLAERKTELKNDSPIPKYYQWVDSLARDSKHFFHMKEPKSGLKLTSLRQIEHASAVLAQAISAVYHDALSLHLRTVDVCIIL